MMDQAENLLRGKERHVVTRLEENADGTIDAEIRLKIPRGKSVFEYLVELQDAVKPVTNTFVSTGIMMPPFEDSKDYEKLGGRVIARAHYQRSSRYLLNITGANAIAERAAENRRRKPDWVFMRIHWNKEVKRPEKYQGEKRKRRKR